MTNLKEEVRSNEASDANVAKVDLKLEVVVIPVADADGAKKFYASLGWRLDADFPFDNGFRVVQFTPPGSGARSNSVPKSRLPRPARPAASTSSFPTSKLRAKNSPLVGSRSARSSIPGTPGAQFQPDSTSGRVPGPAPITAPTAPSPLSATPTAMGGCCRK